MDLNFGLGALLLLLIAAVVAMLTRRLRLPYSVGLVAAGMALAMLPLSLKITLTKELIFDTLLPPLIFEAAFYLRWNQLRRELPVVLSLASAGVVFAGAVTAMGMHYLASWQWPSAVVFGSLIAATDPVSVISTFREAAVHGRLPLLIEAESLFNDGTAAVAFTIAVLFGNRPSANCRWPDDKFVGDRGWSSSVRSGGRRCCPFRHGTYRRPFGRAHIHDGCCIRIFSPGGTGAFLWGICDNHGGSNSCNWGPLGALSDQGREAVRSFWEYAAFVANSLVFLLIGMRETSQDIVAVWLPSAIAILFVLLGRAAAVYPICLLFVRSGLRVTLRHQHALLWGGLRGALALALALGLPMELPRRAEIITVSFAVVAFSVFVQGLTMPLLLRVIGEISSVHKNGEVRGATRPG